MLLYAIVFLTFWMIILVVFHQYTYKYIDLLYLTFICLILGSYISFINPGKYIYKSGEKEEIIEFNGFHRIIIIDISPNYKPSKIMLTGEPYLLNYKSTISNILKKHNFSYIEYIPNHVGFWYYNHNNCYEQYPFIFEI